MFLTRELMHILIDEGVQNLNSFSNDIIQPEVKDNVLNKVIEKFVDSFFPTNIATGIPTFQATQEAFSALHTLIFTELFNPPHNSSDGSVRNFIVDTKCRHLIRVDLSVVSCEIVKVRQARHMSNVNATIANSRPFHKTSAKSPIIVAVSRGLTTPIIREFDILTDNSFKVTKAEVQYIRNPVVLTEGVNCDLPDAVHYKIVELAVADILETIQSARWQTKVAQNNLNNN